jgi:hypothetical protein
MRSDKHDKFTKQIRNLALSAAAITNVIFAVARLIKIIADLIKTIV